MNTKNVTRSVFEEFFKQAMSVKSFVQYNDDGSKSVVEVTPGLTIRDYNIKEYPSCDSDFTDLEEAWKYFSEVGSYSRIILPDGTIVADFYGDGESQ